MADEVKPAAAPNTEGEPGKETPSGEVKPGEEKPKIDGEGTKPGEKPADNKEVKPGDVPEKYDLKLPDGTIVDEPMMTEFTTWAKANKLTNDQAQLAAELHLKAVGAFAAHQAAEFEHEQEAWLNEIKADKDLGGAKVDGTLAVARRVLALKIPGVNMERFKADLDRGAVSGNHPDLVRILHFVGQQIGEDNMWVPTKPGEAPIDAATVLYGKKET